ncbi:FAD-binding oxidoreductase [Streptomyces antimycoticus]|uniref:FAD-binding oxidoreductase n=1 Tax=Streptomyces antimycoticus TaxID=68175 RepID=UPI00381C4661
MRGQVVGVEAVLADGRVLNRLSGLPKDSSGYDLTQLLVGSEGTLAVITRVRLRLIPLFTDRDTVLLALQDTAAALRVLALVRGSVPSLDSAEITYADGLELVHKHLRLPAPFRTRAPYPVHLLLACAAQRDPADDPIEGPGAQPRPGPRLSLVSGYPSHGRRSRPRGGALPPRSAEGATALLGYLCE